MKLLLQQHGEAQPASQSAERELTPHGAADVANLARVLGAAGVRVTQVLHSGKTRAHQTAEIMGRALAPEAVPRSVSGLAPNDPVEPIAATFAELDCDTLVVGHLPFMGRLASFLVSGRTEPALMQFLPGSIICLVRDDSGQLTIAWMLRPELLPLP